MNEMTFETLDNEMEKEMEMIARQKEIAHARVARGGAVRASARRLILDEMHRAEGTIQIIESRWFTRLEIRSDDDEEEDKRWIPALPGDDPDEVCAAFGEDHIPLRAILYRDFETLQGRVIETLYEGGLLNEAVRACADFVEGAEGWALYARMRFPGGMRSPAEMNLEFIPYREYVPPDVGEDVDAELAEFQDEIGDIEEEFDLLAV